MLPEILLITKIIKISGKYEKISAHMGGAWRCHQHAIRWDEVMHVNF